MTLVAALAAAIVPATLGHGRHVYDLRVEDFVQSTTRLPGGGAALGSYRTRIVVPVDRRGGGGVETRPAGRAGHVYRTTYRGRFRGHYDLGAGRCSYRIGGSVHGGALWRTSRGLRITLSLGRFPGDVIDARCFNPRTRERYVFLTVEAPAYRACLARAERKAASGVGDYRCSYTFEGVRFRRLGRRGIARVSERRSGRIELRRVGG